MNFLDTYDVPEADPPLQRSAQPEQTLNEEVTQVIGQLGRFWGGFRRQSQTVIETARKDLGDVVTQAQREFEKLTSDALRESAPDQSSITPDPEAEAQAESPSESGTPLASSLVTERGTSPPRSESSSLASPTLLERLQSALPPNLVSTVQSNIPESLKLASESIDLAHLRSEFHRVQDVTRAHAEDYMHRSEVLFKEVVKEAGDALKDVVKVVPPEESDLDWRDGDAWDETDTSAGDLSETGGREKGKRKEEFGSNLRQRATRAEALLKKLRHDPDTLSVDPEADEDTKAEFIEWVKVNVDSKDGGMEGTEWKATIEQELALPVDGAAIQATHDALVPGQFSEETFWTRYFFRVYQTNREAEKRRVLLQGSVDNDEIFSWEDDDDDETPSPSAQKPTLSLPKQASSAQSSTLTSLRNLDKGAIQSPVFLSPHESSEESYDLVSSANVSVSGGKRKGSKDEEADAGDADSDWE